MWILFALGASALWGLTYALSEKIYARISIPTSLGISSVVSGLIVLIFAWTTGLIVRDIKILAGSGRLSRMLIAETVALTLAEICVGWAITSKNATLMGVIEISFPIFIAFFTYLLFRESHVNLSVYTGGALIFVGVFVIYYFNR